MTHFWLCGELFEKCTSCWPDSSRICCGPRIKMFKMMEKIKNQSTMIPEPSTHKLCLATSYQVSISLSKIADMVNWLSLLTKCYIISLNCRNNSQGLLTLANLSFDTLTKKISEQFWRKTRVLLMNIYRHWATFVTQLPGSITSTRMTQMEKI